MYTTKKKVKISYDLFSSTIDFLEDLDTDYFEPETMQFYGYVLHAFNLKKKAILNQLTKDSPDDEYYPDEWVVSDGNLCIVDAPDDENLPF